MKQSLLEKRLRGAFKPNGCRSQKPAAAARRPGSALVPIQPHGSRPPLILIHGAGGGLLWGYRNLAVELGNEQPVYAIEPRSIANGRDLATVEDMAGAYMEELRAFQERGPYYLSGYCFGGLIAYELARRLWVRCEAVGALILIDAPAPNGSYHRVPWWKPRFVFDFARNCFCWAQDFRHLDARARRNFFRRKITVAGRKLFRRLRHPGQLPDRLDLEEFIDTSQFPADELQLWQMHLKAELEYVPKPYPGPLTLLRTRGQPMFCSFDRRLGWGDLAAAGVAVKMLPGAHERIFEPPHVRSLAEATAACLGKAHFDQKYQSL